MKKLAAALVLLLVAAYTFVFMVSTPPVKHAAAAAPVAVAEPAYPRTVVKLILGADGGNCSGVVIAPNLILTAKHCEGLVSPSVEGKPAQILRKAPDADLMLLGVEVKCPCARIGDTPAVDDLVIAVGFPYGGSLKTNFVTAGAVAGAAYVKEWGYGPVLLLTLSVAPGNSGGGLFALQDNRWRLIGIVVAKGDGEITLAVDTATVVGFLGGA